MFGLQMGRMGRSSSGRTLAAQIKAMYAAGEQGAWYDPSDWSTLFQDSAGTTPVTAVGQPVGLMLDKSGRGNHATQPTTPNRPVLQTDGKHYLSFNGTNQWMATAAIDFTATDKMMVVAGVRAQGTGYIAMLSADTETIAGGFRLDYGDNSSTYSAQIGSSRTGRKLFATPGAYPSPALNVVTAAFSLSAVVPPPRLRVNAQSPASLSAIVNEIVPPGMFGAHPFYVGAGNNGTTRHFNGNLYGLILRGALSSDPQIASAERWMASKTGVTI